MGRREVFRNERLQRRKFILALFLCCMLLVSGLCVVDYSTNVLLYNRNYVGFFSVRNQKTYLELSIFNKKVYINTSYVNRDLERLSQYIGRLF